MRKKGVNRGGEDLIQNRTRREVEMEETPPPFSLPGRDRERWGGPAANILPVAMPLLLASSSHPVCQGWVVCFFFKSHCKSLSLSPPQ